MEHKLDTDHTAQDRFKQEFKAYITESKEYKQYTQMPYTWTAVEQMYGVQLPRTAPMIAIHLPDDRFEYLMGQQGRIDRLEADADHGRQLWRIQQKEQQIRADNPAVQLAYDQYKMLLELVRK